jgi:hypothetical protein
MSMHCSSVLTELWTAGRTFCFCFCFCFCSCFAVSLLEPSQFIGKSVLWWKWKSVVCYCSLYKIQFVSLILNISCDSRVTSRCCPTFAYQLFETHTGAIIHTHRQTELLWPHADICWVPTWRPAAVSSYCLVVESWRTDGPVSRKTLHSVAAVTELMWPHADICWVPTWRPAAVSSYCVVVSHDVQTGRGAGRHCTQLRLLLSCCGHMLTSVEFRREGQQL